jgi:hypothetical protein
MEGCPIVSAGTAAIRTRALLACEPFGARLAASRVAAALAAGLIAGGRPEPDVVELPRDAGDRRAAGALAEQGFHARMLASRAVLVAVPALSERTLAGSAAFEVATLARQNGVPCYAVAAKVTLNSFDLRILDLQLVLQASSPASLRRAGKRLAEVI